MNRRRDDLQKIDTSAWAAVDPNALAAAKRKTFEARYEAINLYATGQTLREIEKQTSINSRQLYGLLDRCLTQADDGRLVGFRGLLKHDRFGSYARTAKLPAEYSASGRGLVGAFAFLLEQHPPLAQWLTQKIRKHAVTLHQVSTDGPLKTRLNGLCNLHAGFLTQCRAVGITAADYPLNTDRMGIRSLSAYVTAQILTNFGDAARTAGATHLKGMPGGAGRGAVRPYQVVEFDGHRLNVRLKIVIRDPLGLEQEFEVERIWLLVIIDVCTRAVLGYHLVLSREYGQTNFPRRTDWSFTRFYLQQAVDAGYRLVDDAQVLWEAFAAIHNKAGLAGALEIPMESFTRAVEIVLKESELQDAAHYRPSAQLWIQAVRSSGYVQARVATTCGLSELSSAA